MGLDVVLDDCLDRKQAVLHVDYKIMYLTFFSTG